MARINHRWHQESIDELNKQNILFYDIETDGLYPAYCKLRLIVAQFGLNSEPVIVFPDSDKFSLFLTAIENPDIIKVGFNNKNFDDIVLANHKIFIEETNSHDLYLMAKTLIPRSPSYGMKFLNWWYLGDCHWPEFEMNLSPDKAEIKQLKKYALHDIVQTVNLFKLFWDHIIKNEFWKPYRQDLAVGTPLMHMELIGGVYTEKPSQIKNRIAKLQKRLNRLQRWAYKYTDGKVTNINSSKQTAEYLKNYENLELELSDKGNFLINKDTLNEYKQTSQIARAIILYRTYASDINFCENFLEALDESPNSGCWLPTQFSISAAKSRRFVSNSKFKINWQNLNANAKRLIVCPKNEILFSIDATQIENVVHIYESKDEERKKEYIADENWNEYVWLCNKILGINKTKQELDSIPSEQIPKWSMYKQYKTGKLALNFGMGLYKFAKLFGIPTGTAKTILAEIHAACPAIKSLQERVAYDLATKGYVSDVFGYRYTGSVNKAYKVVAYLIQGCGTGAIPKKQIRNLFDVLEQEVYGVLSGTTHDEIYGRLNKKTIGSYKQFIAILQKMMYAMTNAISVYFDGIPIRAKLYLSTTNFAECIEIKNKIEPSNSILKQIWKNAH